MISDENTSFRMVIMTEFDGTDFVGFQRQNNGRSVQQVLEETLSTIYGCPISVCGCSRTDSGVHAKGHVSHADVPFMIPPDKLPFAMNALLPEDISVKAAALGTREFHARFLSLGKRYTYRIWNSPIRPTIDRRSMAHVPGYLSIEKMRAAAEQLVGEHDFSAFCAISGAKVNPVRSMESIEVISYEDSPLIEIVVTGKSFLYNMVRIMAGTIVYAGQGRMEPADIGEILAGRDRRLSGKTMPAKGLTLERVFYNPDPFTTTVKNSIIR